MRGCIIVRAHRILDLGAEFLEGVAEQHKSESSPLKCLVHGIYMCLHGSSDGVTSLREARFSHQGSRTSPATCTRRRAKFFDKQEIACDGGSHVMYISLYVAPVHAAKSYSMGETNHLGPPLCAPATLFLASSFSNRFRTP